LKEHYPHLQITAADEIGSYSKSSFGFIAQEIVPVKAEFRIIKQGNIGFVYERVQKDSEIAGYKQGTIEVGYDGHIYPLNPRAHLDRAGNQCSVRTLQQAQFNNWDYKFNKLITLGDFRKCLAFVEAVPMVMGSFDFYVRSDTGKPGIFKFSNEYTTHRKGVAGPAHMVKSMNRQMLKYLVDKAVTLGLLGR
jgi:hypothetical protein